MLRMRQSSSRVGGWVDEMCVRSSAARGALEQGKQVGAQAQAGIRQRSPELLPSLLYTRRGGEEGLPWLVAAPGSLSPRPLKCILPSFLY